MIRAFIDSTVLFSASLSPTGASAEILKECIQGNVVLVISDVVVLEVERNISGKVPHVLPLFHQLIQRVPFEQVQVTPEEVADAANYTELKDAPIVAAARKAHVDYLLTFDRKHLLNPPEVATQSGLTIMLPEELLKILRHA